MKKYLGLITILVLALGFLGVNSVSARGPENRGGNDDRRPVGRPGFDNKDKRGPEQGIIGVVTAINGTSLTVSGKLLIDQKMATTTYAVEASAARVIKNNATSTIASVLVGDLVVVRGAINGTSVVALTVHDGAVAGSGLALGRSDERPGNLALASSSARGIRSFFNRVGRFFGRSFGF